MRAGLQLAWRTAGSSLSALVLFIYCVTLAWSHCTVGEVTNRGEPQQSTLCRMCVGWFMAIVDFCRSLSIICFKAGILQQIFLLGYQACNKSFSFLRGGAKMCELTLTNHAKALDLLTWCWKSTDSISLGRNRTLHVRSRKNLTAIFIEIS